MFNNISQGNDLIRILKIILEEIGLKIDFSKSKSRVIPLENRLEFWGCSIEKFL